MTRMKKVTIITTCFNSEKTIEKTIQSVVGQSYSNIEYIIVDGKSSDGTLDIVNKYWDQITTIISEEDHGLYDAINKGINIATGEIVGVVHAGDVYTKDTTLETVVKSMEKKNVDSCYGDLIYVGKKESRKVVRYWRTGECSEKKLLQGWMPPHPTFFVKKKVYESCGLYDVKLSIAADYDLMIRFLFCNKISSQYIPEVLVRMQVGGKSNKNLVNIMRKMKEDYYALHKSGIPHAFAALCLKNVTKIKQFAHYGKDEKEYIS